MSLPENLFVGTSSWSKSDWLDAFYPPNFSLPTYVFFTNYYGGFAPGSVKLFEDLWDKS
jgi:uncharacterized protein YecE (DUF72 family)